jgi:hypothetical protein
MGQTHHWTQRELGGWDRDARRSADGVTSRPGVRHDAARGLVHLPDICCVGVEVIMFIYWMRHQLAGMALRLSIAVGRLVVWLAGRDLPGHLRLFKVALVISSIAVWIRPLGRRRGPAGARAPGQRGCQRLRSPQN